MVARSADFPIFHGAMPSWDNTARRPDGKSYVFTNASPAEYKKWLQIVCEHTDQEHAEPEKLVFINAWNEWAEGAYLEPDRKYGYAYLEATARVQEEIRARQYAVIHKGNFAAPVVKESAIAVILHLYHFDLWEEIALFLDNIAEPFDLYLTVSDRFDPQALDRVLACYPRTRIRMVENRGRDIAPFLKVMAEILPLGYQAVCKIHTKKSHHLEDGKGWRLEEGNTWRYQLLSQLLGTKKTVRDIIDRFRQNSQQGIIGPGRDLMNYRDAVGANEGHVRYLQDRLRLMPFKDFDFFAGSMFWFRPEALKNILELKLSVTDFQPETGQIDGTLAHALERVFCLVARQGGYSVNCVQDILNVSDTARLVYDNWSDLHA